MGCHCSMHPPRFQIGDPLKNRSEQVDSCDMVLRSRFPAFYNAQESRSSLQKKATNPDEFRESPPHTSLPLNTLIGSGVQSRSVPA